MSEPNRELEDFVEDTSDVLLTVSEMIRSLHGEKNIEQLKKNHGDGDSLVTYIDNEMSEFIIDLMRSKYPRYGILSEEKTSGTLGKKQHEGEGKYLVLIDPLDGTRDFINGTGEFVTTVALIDRCAQRPVACIVLKPFGYDPERKMPRIEIVSAIEGQGARLKAIYQSQQDGKSKIERVTMKLAVSQNSELNRCTLLKSRYHSNPTLEKILHDLPVVRVLEVGSAGNKLLTIAKGEADIYLHCGEGRKLYEWDIPPELIVREAGGKTSTVYGQTIVYDQADPTQKCGILATNGLVHDGLLQILRNALVGL